MAVSSKDLEPICSTGFLQGILLRGIKVKNEKFLVESCFRSKKMLYLQLLLLIDKNHDCIV